ncbi:hypothetical protein MNV_2010018 [Candidatus Methanoperedens nitroreducens]|uniref:Uncharacterized protein n=1 Tax=Candidatus Methanoperedens nitratireducens TaxID=1392998 RepID=A0A284VNB2_9EURY|nr:hypothetical protein MNV_2010018 [Candidatus Methanoperedens nitroreducens]
MTENYRYHHAPLNKWITRTPHKIQKFGTQKAYELNKESRQYGGMQKYR